MGDSGEHGWEDIRVEPVKKCEIFVSHFFDNCLSIGVRTYRNFKFVLSIGIPPVNLF